MSDSCVDKGKIYNDNSKMNIGPKDITNQQPLNNSNKKNTYWKE